MHKFSKFVFSDTWVRVTFSKYKDKTFLDTKQVFSFIAKDFFSWGINSSLIEYKDKTFLNTMQVFSQKYFQVEKKSFELNLQEVESTRLFV